MAVRPSPFELLLLLLFLIALLAAALFSAQSSQAANRLQVLSYNIRYNTPADGENAWPLRKDKVAQLVSDLEPDLCGFQEALIGQVRDLQQRLPDFDWVGVGRNDGEEQGEFTPVFYRRERLELLAARTFWLSEAPEAPGSKSWDAALPRIVTWARFRDRRTETEFYFFNTHFDHRGVEARQQSALLLAERLPALAGAAPFLLAGDFNFDERSRPYRLLTAAESPFRDARYASRTPHRGPTASFNDWRALRPEESRIDYLFVSKEVQVHAHRILDTRFDGRFPSDHLPVWAQVEFTGSARP